MSGRILLTSVVVALSCVRAQANVADFNALSAGSSYAAPAIFSNGGLDFEVLFSHGNLNVSAASSLINPAFTGNYLYFTSNVGLNVNLPTGALQIKFDFIENSPAVAFVINGGWLNNSQIPTTVNGVTVTHQLGSTSTPWGSITATGNISAFIAIGSEYKIDNFNATLLPGLAGDYNKNHIVDASDYVVWRKTSSTRTGYNSWRSNFGASGGAGTSVTSTGIPEPSTLALLLVGLQGIVIARRPRCVSVLA